MTYKILLCGKKNIFMNILVIGKVDYWGFVILLLRKEGLDNLLSYQATKSTSLKFVNEFVSLGQKTQDIGLLLVIANFLVLFVSESFAYISLIKIKINLQ